MDILGLLREFLPSLEGLPSAYLGVSLGVGILVGLIQCFWGYRLFRLVLGIVGFLVGAALGWAIGLAFIGEQWGAILGAILGGAIGAGLLSALYFLGVFVMGAILGAILGATLLGVGGLDQIPVLLIVLGIVGGILAVIFQKAMIILSTAFSGAWSVVTGIAYFLGGGYAWVGLADELRRGGWQTIAILLAWIALGIVGSVVQFRTAPEKPKPRPTG